MKRIKRCLCLLLAPLLLAACGKGAATWREQYDLGGDGIPELIIYNGCEYEADALFDEFQNGESHTLAAYTLAEIDAMGWDAFVRETGGQTWL